MNKVRGYIAKPRKTRSKKLKRILLIKAEGRNETERKYFHNFNSDKLLVRYCAGNETDPVNMMQQLLKEYQKMDLLETDMAVCLVDTDFDDKKDCQLAQADELVAKSGYKNLAMYTSSPCFEIWFMCHFGVPNRPYQNNKEVIGDMIQKFGAYSKSDAGIYLKLAGREKQAIKNAQILEKHCRDQGQKQHTVAFRNSTEVYKLFEKIIL